MEMFDFYFRAELGRRILSMADNVSYAGEMYIGLY